MGGGDGDLKVEAIRGGVRDLRIAAAAAAAMRGDLKMKKDAAMEGGDLNLKLHSVAIEEDFHGESDRDLKTKMNDVGGSEGGDTLERKQWEVKGAILKMKKDVVTAMDLWSRAARMVSKDAQEKAQMLAEEKAAQQQAALLGPSKKKMKVVRTKFSKKFIEYIATNPPYITCSKDPSDEEIAQRKPSVREVYAALKNYHAKCRDYWSVIVAQQKELGYAEDEIEVTDDDEEAVVKN